jgi:benzodiazapine receptor
MKKEYAQWLVLSLFLVICFAAAALGSWFTSLSVDNWYRDIDKPPWTPPNALFAPVWTALYLAMAVAAWLVWRRRGFRGAAVPFLAFFAQLLLNVCWSGVFFGLRTPWGGFLVILLLWWAILATLLAFWGIHRLAGLLFVPYLAWVTYAAGLNYAIWKMNA